MYRAAFGCQAPTLFAERFARAASLLRAACPPEAVERHRALLASNTDLEALEIAARLLGKCRLLSAELSAAVRIAETFPENQHLFVAGPKPALLAWCGLGFAAARSVWKTAKGVVLLAVHARD